MLQESEGFLPSASARQEVCYRGRAGEAQR
jgi:hypothetical protein